MRMKTRVDQDKTAKKATTHLGGVLPEVTRVSSLLSSPASRRGGRGITRVERAFLRGITRVQRAFLLSCVESHV